jgi:hypothetical protein
MSTKKHCDLCGLEIGDDVIHMTLQIGLARGASSVDSDEALDFCPRCCKSELLDIGFYFRAMQTPAFLALLPKAKALPDTAAGSALGNASVLPQ